MGVITINRMSFYAHHGCFEQERVIGTHFEVDLTLTVDTTKAELTDNLDDTVNYLEVYQTVGRVMEQPSHLLEHVAHRIGEEVLCNFPGVQCVGVKLSKLNPPLGGQIESVSVSLEMARQ